MNGLISIQLKIKTSNWFERWNGELPKLEKSFRNWDESVVVKLKNKFTPKLVNHSDVCMLVGYVEINNYGVYLMCNETTNIIHVSRDVVWLKRMFFAKKEEAEEISDKHIDIEKFTVIITLPMVWPSSVNHNHVSDSHS